MSATGAVRADGRESKLAVALEKNSAVAATASGSAAEAKLAVALEALTAIAGVNDLTTIQALFHMRRRAEEGAVPHPGHPGRQAAFRLDVPCPKTRRLRPCSRCRAGIGMIQTGGGAWATPHPFFRYTSEVLAWRLGEGQRLAEAVPVPPAAEAAQVDRVVRHAARCRQVLLLGLGAGPLPPPWPRRCRRRWGLPSSGPILRRPGACSPPRPCPGARPTVPANCWSIPRPWPFFCLMPRLGLGPEDVLVTVNPEGGSPAERQELTLWRRLFCGSRPVAASAVAGWRAGADPGRPGPARGAGPARFFRRRQRPGRAGGGALGRRLSCRPPPGRPRPWACRSPIWPAGWPMISPPSATPCWRPARGRGYSPWTRTSGRGRAWPRPSAGSWPCPKSAAPCFPPADPVS